MSIFSLPRRTAHLKHINVRTEKVGDDSQPAVDLKVTFTTGNDFLDELAPGLKKALFKAPDPTDAQQLFEEPEHLPLIRWPMVPSYSWALECIGREIIIGFGLGGDSDIRFVSATANKWKFTLKEGGSVDVEFRVQAHPNADQVSSLYELLDNEIDISIAAFSGDQHSIDTDADDDDQDDHDDDAPADLVDALAAPAKPKRGRKPKAFADALDGTSDDPFGKTEAETVSAEDWPFPGDSESRGAVQ